jgi:hypothetical protein
MSFSISGGHNSSLPEGFFPATGNLIPKSHDTFNIGFSDSYRYGKIWTNILYTSNGTVATSDFNKKKDIEPIGDALSVIMQLKPKSFKMKNGTSNRVHTGYIAQECENLFCPNWASYVKEGDSIGLRYEQFIALNTRGIQQVNNRLVNMEEFAKQVGEKLSTDFTVSESVGGEKKSELNSIQERLDLIENRLLNSLTQNSLDYFENKLRTTLTDECVSRVNEVSKSDFEMNGRLKDYVNEMYNRILSDVGLKLEELNPMLTEECKGRVNEMYTNVINEVDSKIENERQKSNEIESIINEFQSRFNNQICDLVDKVNILISRCHELENSRLIPQLEMKGEDVSSPLHEQMVSLVDKVNFLITKCDDIENLRERYGKTLENDEKIEMLMIFEKSFRQEIVDLVGRVDSLSNELENFKISTKTEIDLFSGLLNRVNLISTDIDSMKIKQDDCLREQSEQNSNFEQCFRQEMLELLEKVNLLATDLEMIKEAITKSSKEQKSEELELISSLIEKINILGVELNSLKDSQNQGTLEHKHEEFELLNSLLEKVNLLTSDLESFRENVKQLSQSENEGNNDNENFENRFRDQMLDLIEKVNSLVLRCNDLDSKLSTIPHKPDNKIEFDDSDSCGSSMMETMQERLYKAEQLIGKQQKMITKLTSAVNSLLKANDNK